MSKPGGLKNNYQFTVKFFQSRFNVLLFSQYETTPILEAGSMGSDVYGRFGVVAALVSVVQFKFPQKRQASEIFFSLPGIKEYVPLASLMYRRYPNLDVADSLNS